MTRIEIVGFLMRVLSLVALVALAACSASSSDEDSQKGSAQAIVTTPLAATTVYFHGDAGLYPWNRVDVIQPRYANRDYLPAVDQAMAELGDATGVVVIGYSYGRRPAVELVTRLGDRAARLVLLDPVDEGLAPEVTAWGGSTLLLCGSHDPKTCNPYPGHKCFYPFDHPTMFGLLDKAAAWTDPDACPVE